MTSPADARSDTTPKAGTPLAAVGRWVSAACAGAGGVIAGGLVLTLAQIAFFSALTYETSFGTTYLKLFYADSHWYENIAQKGYHTILPPGLKNIERDNVAFFPGFPLLARVVGDTFDLPSKVAVVLAAQLACWGFWSYFLLLLRRSHASPTGTACAVALMACQPCAFYLVAGFSESLFMMAMLGFLYWAGRDGPGAWWLAAAHGFVMTATRIVGLPIAFAPLLLTLRPAGDPPGALIGRPGKSAVLRLGLLGAVASLGGLLFFAYCQWRFGCWDLYMLTQKNGWGLVPDYLAVFRPEVYEVFIPSVGSDGVLVPEELSQLAVPLTLALLCGGLGIELWLGRRRGAGGWWERAPFHFAAWCMFYISVCGLVSVQMNSMIRYTLPIYVLLVLAGADLLTRCPPRGLARDVGMIAVPLTVLNSVWLQVTLISRFEIARWVA